MSAGLGGGARRSIRGSRRAVLAGFHRPTEIPVRAAEVQDTQAGFEVGEQMRGVGVHAATIEQLLKVVAVAHGVGGFL